MGRSWAAVESAGLMDRRVFGCRIWPAPGRFRADPKEHRPDARPMRNWSRRRVRFVRVASHHRDTVRNGDVVSGVWYWVSAREILTWQPSTLVGRFTPPLSPTSRHVTKLSCAPEHRGRVRIPRATRTETRGEFQVLQHAHGERRRVARVHPSEEPGRSAEPTPRDAAECTPSSRRPPRSAPSISRKRRLPLEAVRDHQ